jgi:hypothetical protein
MERPMSKSIVMLLVFILLTSSYILTFLPVQAEPKNIVVPEDYPTISSAIGNATTGDTILVKKGTYEEKTLEINKTLSIIGEDVNNTKIILDPPWVPTGGFHLSGTSLAPDYGYAHPIDIQANDVKISGFTIISQNGNFFAGGNRTEITRNTIAAALFLGSPYQHNITQNTLTQGIQCLGSHSTITQNYVIGSSISILYGGYSNAIYNNTVINGNGISSVWIGNRIFNNTVENCTRGVGAVGAGSANNVFYANRIVNNDIGLGVSTEGGNNIFYANYVANNTIGVSIKYVFPVGDNNTFYHNNFIGNSMQVQYWDRGYDAARFDNGQKGNYWSDYNGIDVNDDGVGDTPYMIYAPNLADPYRQDRYPLMVPFDIENGSKQDIEPFQTTTLVIASVIIVAIVCIGLLVYFKKRKH